MFFDCMSVKFTTYMYVCLSAVYCTRSQFACYSGECVSDTRRCTGVDSCSDGSDEEGCTDTRTCKSMHNVLRK